MKNNGFETKIDQLPEKALKTFAYLKKKIKSLI